MKSCQIKPSFLFVNRNIISVFWVGLPSFQSIHVWKFLFSWHSVFKFKIVYPEIVTDIFYPLRCPVFMCVCHFQQSFNHITTVSGCDRELSAASQKYHAPGTWHNTTPSHIILALGRPVLALPRKSLEPNEEQLVPFLKTLGCPGRGTSFYEYRYGCSR